jgi:hypothetical protein
MNEKIITITKNVVFEEREFKIVKDLVEREGYGQRGFSIALRKIIREWALDRYGGTEKRVRFLGEEIKPPDDPNDGHLVTVFGESAAEKAAG